VKDLTREEFVGLVESIRGDVEEHDANTQDGTGYYKILGISEENAEALDRLIRLSDMMLAQGLAHPRMIYMSVFLLAVKWNRLEQLDAGDN
jgi:hypothetical protein